MRKSKFKRKCAGCNELKEKSELIKITRDVFTGNIIVNPTNCNFGRSVYVCKNPKCIEDSFKKGKFFKVLKTKPDDTIKNKILNSIEY